MQMLLAGTVHSQSIEEIKVTAGMSKGETLESLFRNIEKQSGLLFAFDYEKVNQYNNIAFVSETRTIKETLTLALRETPFLYRQVKNSVIIFREGEEQNLPDEISNAFQKTEELVRLTGTVTDSQGMPMAGVNVIEKSSMNGANTNADGHYAIQVEEGAVLVFSFIGFQTFETEMNNRTVIDVVMREDVATLKEVEINAGYWDLKEREKTGSISKVGAEVIARQPVTNPLGALSGRMPGVFIQQTTGIPGGDFDISIRGRNSLREDGNEPLYIVDGVPFSSEKVSTPENADGLFNLGISALTSINPTDIESIEILKDADATAIYGSRGANGVVLISTKRGKAGKTRFDLNVYSGGGKVPRLELLSTKQYLAMRKEAFTNDGITPSADPVNPGYAPDLMLWDTTRHTDWQKKLIGNTAVSTSIQSSLSGGNEHTQFLFSGGYRRETSVFPGNFGYQKGSSHLSINHLSSNKKFSTSVSVSATLDKNKQTDQDFAGLARGLPPVAPALVNEDGELNWENSTWTNPLASARNSYKGRTENIIGNATLAYEILTGLKIKMSAGLNNLRSDELTLFPSTAYDPAQGATSARSSLIKGNGHLQSWIIEPQLSWDKKIGRMQATALIGGSLQEQQFERSAVYYENFPSNALLSDLSSAAITHVYSFSQYVYHYAALFGRLNFNWSGRYIINLTGRRDGSSRFGPGKQFSNFGAVGGAWIFSDESFIKGNKLLSFGKLRGSYGITGSDQIGDYQFLDTYAAAGPSYQGVSGLTSTRIYNPDFAWEENRKLEGALELGLIRDRILLNVSYYCNWSSNQLVNYTLPMTTGFTGVLANLKATVQNTGWEADLTVVNLYQRAIEWTTSFNLTIPKNKLVEFPDIESSSYANIYIVGKPIYIKQYYESTGVDPQTGLYTFRDFNEDGVITADDDQKKAVFVGQNYYGGLNNSLSYKGWKLDIFFQFVSQSGFNYKYQSPLIGPSRNLPLQWFEEKRWQKPGDVAGVQRLATSFNNEANSRAIVYGQSSDAVISDASFIRLKNISLSYQFPQKWTKDLSGRIYVQGQNLFVLTKYKGFDPEIQIIGIGPVKMLTVGIQLTL
jgi:TonB-linked SusC/RagA family outer membrane protein